MGAALNKSMRERWLSRAGAADPRRWALTRVSVAPGLGHVAPATAAARKPAVPSPAAPAGAARPSAAPAGAARPSAAPAGAARPAAAGPARILLFADDRRYRALAATLLAQRGYAVAVGGRGDDVVELARRMRADVVVIDAGSSLTTAARHAARLDTLRPRVGVVTVSGESDRGLVALPVLAKWSSFDEVLAAIDRVRPLSSPPEVHHGAV